MPSAVESSAPASAPTTRALSIVARDSPTAPIRCRDGMVSPMSVLRITCSLGRTMPASVAMTSTQLGVRVPVRVSTRTKAASEA